MADDNPRKQRLQELAKNRANLVEPERSEFDALSQEFPETASTFQEEDAQKEARAQQPSRPSGESGKVSSGNPTGRGR